MKQCKCYDNFTILLTSSEIPCILAILKFPLCEYCAVNYSQLGLTYMEIFSFYLMSLWVNFYTQYSCISRLFIAKFMQDLVRFFRRSHDLLLDVNR